MKEAYLKATGAGLRGTLPGFDAPLQPGQAVPVQTAPGEARGSWTVQAFDVGIGYSAAVAIEGDGALIRSSHGRSG